MTEQREAYPKEGEAAEQKEAYPGEEGVMVKARGKVLEENYQSP